MCVAIETCECATWHNNTIMNRGRMIPFRTVMQLAYSHSMERKTELLWKEVSYKLLKIIIDMTTIRYNFRQIFIMVLLAVFSSSYAADKPQKVITVTIPKFGSGLVETWIKKYTEAHPDVHIRIVEKNKGQADLEFVSETPEGDSEEYITYVGRYALLPVTTTEIPCMRYSPVSALMRRI